MSAPCQRVQGRLEELLDGGLDPLAAARDEGHLEACAACARELRAWTALLDAARAAGRPDPAELSYALAGLDATLASAGGPRREPAGRRLELVPLATAAAALCGLLALGFCGVASPADVDLFAGLSARLERPAPALPRWTSLLDGLLGRGGGR